MYNYALACKFIHYNYVMRSGMLYANAPPMPSCYGSHMAWNLRLFIHILCLYKKGPLFKRLLYFLESNCSEG